MRLLTLLLPVLLLAGCQPRMPTHADSLAAIARGEVRVVDLSWPLNEQTPGWPGDPAEFCVEISEAAREAGYFSRSFSMPEHFGTHMDAPIHFPPGTIPVDAIPVERLFGPAVVIDVVAQAAQQADYRLTVSDVNEWERRNRTIPRGAIVLLRTGWAAHWPDAQRYANPDAEGVLRFPGYSVEAARLLVERGVVGLGIDTLSVDYGPSKDFEVHRQTHGAGLYHLENLTNLNALPERGASLVVAPIKLGGGSGGPVRVFAVLPD
jgi:kynurenine formamidase